MVGFLQSTDVSAFAPSVALRATFLAKSAARSKYTPAMGEIPIRKCRKRKIRQRETGPGMPSGRKTFLL